MEDYCTFEQAVQLKELGFDWECRNNGMRYLGVETPTLSQVQKWFYKNHNIWIEIGDYSKLNPDWDYRFAIITPTDSGEASKSDYNDPFEALSAGVTEAIKILKLQNK